MSARSLRLPPRLAELTPVRAGTLVLVLGLAVIGAAWLYCFDPAQGGPYPACYFHQTTGWLCPGCGCLRATHQLLHGHWAAAWYFNPLFVLSLPVAGGLAGWWSVNLLRGRPVVFIVRPAWLWSGGAMILVFTVLRNLPWPQAAWLGLHP